MVCSGAQPCDADEQHSSCAAVSPGKDEREADPQQAGGAGPDQRRACRAAGLVLARGQLLGVRAVARTMISHTFVRKASAAASQPATTANPYVTNRRSTSATTSPINATPAARRMAGAVPAHPAVVQDWWRDGGHRRSVADPNSACHRPPSRSFLAQLALRTALQAGRLGRDPGRGHGSTSLVVSAAGVPECGFGLVAGVADQRDPRLSCAGNGQPVATHGNGRLACLGCTRPPGYSRGIGQTSTKER